MFKKKLIHSLPIKIPPKIVNGPRPETAYFAHVTEFNNTPDQVRTLPRRFLFLKL